MSRIIIFFLIFSALSYSQEKAKSFVNPPQTKPRFLEDINLTEQENLESFRKKISTHFIQNIENSNLKDSIKNKFYVSFKIDTLGISRFHNIKPQSLETQFIKEKFSIIINSLPKLIPATQRNKKVSIFYTIPVFRNK